jgi:hypothetical protein
VKSCIEKFYEEWVITKSHAEKFIMRTIYSTEKSLWSGSKTEKKMNVELIIVCGSVTVVEFEVKWS